MFAKKNAGAAATKNCEIADVRVLGELKDDNAVIMSVKAPAPNPDNARESTNMGGDHAMTYMAHPAPLKRKQTVAATRMFVRVGGRPLITNADSPLPSEKAPMVHPK